MTLAPLLIPVVWFGIIGTVIFLVNRAQKEKEDGERAAFRRAATTLPQADVDEHGTFASFVARDRRVHLSREGAQPKQAPTWRVGCDRIALGAHTTLRITHRQFPEWMARAVGQAAVLVGERSFDQVFRVTASDPDVARQVLSSPSVRAAIAAALARATLPPTTLELDATGALRLQTPIQGGAGDDLPRVVQAFLDVADALDQAGRAALPAPGGVDVVADHGVGAGSGTPFAVPAPDGEKR